MSHGGALFKVSFIDTISSILSERHLVPGRGTWKRDASKVPVIAEPLFKATSATRRKKRPKGIIRPLSLQQLCLNSLLTLLRSQITLLTQQCHSHRNNHSAPSVPEQRDTNRRDEPCNDIETTLHQCPLSGIATNASSSTILTASNNNYIIPPRCSFFRGDLLGIGGSRSYDCAGGELSHPLCQLHGPGFPFVVVDPPWPSKSVARRKNYRTFGTRRSRDQTNKTSSRKRKFSGNQKDTPPSSNGEWEKLFDLPIANVLRPGGLLVVWVTNNPAVKRFVVNKLLPSWQCTVVGTWWWLKLTSNGQLVVPPPRHAGCRAPYEPFVIAQRKSLTKTISRPCIIPAHNIVCSVRTFHSEKPDLEPHFRRWLPHTVSPSSDFRALEVFARRLREGWCSAGDEVLKFQHVDYFQCMKQPPQTSSQKDPYKQLRSGS